MRTELSFILLLSVSIGLAGARPQAVDQGKKAQDGQSCGSPKVPFQQRFSIPSVDGDVIGTRKMEKPG